VKFIGTALLIDARNTPPASLALSSAASTALFKRSGDPVRAAQLLAVALGM
jgi:hypothetical protein